MLLQVSNETDGVLNFTVQPHFPAQIYSSPIISLKFCLYHIFPSETPEPSNAESTALGKLEILGNSTRAIFLQVNVSNEHNSVHQKARQIRSGRALRNCPTQGIKEVTLILSPPWRTWLVYLILFLSELHSYQS